jgi:hypothetical protein
VTFIQRFGDALDLSVHFHARRVRALASLQLRRCERTCPVKNRTRLHAGAMRLEAMPSPKEASAGSGRPTVLVESRGRSKRQANCAACRLARVNIEGDILPRMGKTSAAR